MFVWTSYFQNPLAHTHFNIWMSANKIPEKVFLGSVKATLCQGQVECVC